MNEAWRAEIAVPRAAAGDFAEALEALCDSVLVLGEDSDPMWVLRGWTDGPPDRARLTAVLALLAAEHGIEDGVNLFIAPQEQKDWVAENLRSFAPIRAGRFYLHGSHVTEAPPDDAIALCVDATTAFGTGEHASTRGCLLALDRLPGPAPRRVLDMGCGSAILGMAAARLWGARVVAADIDPRAVEVAGVNARRNGVAEALTCVVSDGYRHPEITARAPYDLVLANILANPLIALAPDLATHLAPGGRAVLAGFLEADAGAVEAAHRAQGLDVADRARVDDWVTLVILRDGSS